MSTLVKWPGRVVDYPHKASGTDIRKLEKRMLATGKAIDKDLMLREWTGHYFCEGLYSRSFLLPKGVLATSQTHAKENFLLVVQGETSIISEEGTVRVKAPFMMVTRPGTKRAVYGHEDTIFITFHPNPENAKDQETLSSLFTIPEEQDTELLSAEVKADVMD